MRKSLIIHPSELSIDWIDKAIKSGCNAIGLHPIGGENAHLSAEELLCDLEKKEFRKLIDYAKKSGLEIEYEMHAARYFLKEELFAEHPEYFRMNETGERTTDFNFCVSNEEALEIVANNAAALAEKLYGSCRNYYFWLDDVRESGCCCDKCKNFTPSDQQMIVINKIAKKLREIIPGARIAYLAYHDCLAPPKSVKPEEGVFLEYAPIEKWYGDNIVKMEELDGNIKELIEFFGKENSKVLEYWYDNSLFSRYKLPPVKFIADNELIKKEIKIYEEYGFEQIASFACFLGSDYIELYGEPDLSAFNN
ncbi:MAG: DUF4838 domain-containing protein [Clostridia bacterium]|nr:DUF4838 domain-containing protein [Clostridia bacterium]